MLPELTIYTGLFFAALIAATIIPAQSEALLVGLLLTQNYNTLLLLLVASVGNILGSVINYYLGYGMQKFKDRPWFPVKPAALDRAMGWYRHYGRWSLLLSWAPIIGDPLTVAAGILRERFSVFLALVTFAKTARYAVLTLITLNVF